MGIFKDGKVEIIPNEQGHHITPSYVAFNANGERLIGESALNQLTSNPTPFLMSNDLLGGIGTILSLQKM